MKEKTLKEQLETLKNAYKFFSNPKLAKKIKKLKADIKNDRLKRQLN